MAIDHIRSRHGRCAKLSKVSSRKESTPDQALVAVQHSTDTPNNKSVIAEIDPREAALDAAIEMTFPASDPPAFSRRRDSE